MNLTVCQHYGFFGVLAAVIRESSDKQLVLRIVKALLFIHQPDLMAQKASDVSAADWLHQHTWKNAIFFYVCCYGFSQSRKSLYNPAVCVIISFITSSSSKVNLTLELEETIDFKNFRNTSFALYIRSDNIKVLSRLISFFKFKLLSSIGYWILTSEGLSVCCFI